MILDGLFATDITKIVNLFEYKYKLNLYLAVVYLIKSLVICYLILSLL